MDSYLCSNSVVGVLSCGLYFVEEALEYYKTKANQYLESDGDIDFPRVDLTIDKKYLLNSICYTVRMVPISLNNDYAIISGTEYSVFKVIKKRENQIRLIWHGKLYTVVTEKILSTFRITINLSQVVHVKVIDELCHESFFLTFPAQENLQSNELISLLDQCLSDLNNTLNGYNLPEPFFEDNMRIQLERMFTILQDPILPSCRFQSYLDGVRTLLPNNLLRNLQQIMCQYTYNVSSLLSVFPSNKIKVLIDNYIGSINNKSIKQDMTVVLRPALEIAEMYSSGTRGYVKDVIEKLLLDYLKVEIKFQHEDCLLNSISFNSQVTVAEIFSHQNLKYKNRLILALIDFLERFLPGVIQDMKGIIQRLLSNLTKNAYSVVISKLRELLIIGQVPTYEVRKNEMEAVFLNSIDGNSNGTQDEHIENLICSNNECLDIISDFFFHNKLHIRKCALEVYVRRVYMAVDIRSFEYAQLTGGHLCLLFKYSLPKRSNTTNWTSFTGQKVKRRNSYVGPTNRTACSNRKFSLIYHKRSSSGYIESEDMSVEQLQFEDHYDGDSFVRQKSPDYDTDSAISIGTCSQSELSFTNLEQTESCSRASDINLSKSRLSPTFHSLDLRTSYADNNNNTRTSNVSINRSTTQACHRSVSMFCNNNQSIDQIQDLSNQYDLGVVTIFKDLQELDRNLNAIKSLLSVRNSLIDDMDYLRYDFTAVDRDPSPIFKVVLTIIIHEVQLIKKCDDDVTDIIYEFCKKNVSFFEEICVVRITFLLQSNDKTIRYFTFQNRGYFEEDINLRNLDPITSFQLEMNRFGNYHLERMSTPNRSIYMYMATCKETPVILNSKYRIFARRIIYQKDRHKSTSNVDFMAKEAERHLLEVMDAFDIASMNEKAMKTNSNHIFFYFHSILRVNKIEELENVLRTIIFKHGRRLWSLRVHQAELKMSVVVNCGLPIPVRLWVHNESGRSLKIGMYREEYKHGSDINVLVSLSANNDGRYNEIPVDSFYSV